jgi:hypothetical protein
MKPLALIPEADHFRIEGLGSEYLTEIGQVKNTHVWESLNRVIVKTATSRDSF